MLRFSRMVPLEDAGAGLTSQRVAKLASDRTRSTLSPAASSSRAADIVLAELHATRPGYRCSSPSPSLPVVSCGLLAGVHGSHDTLEAWTHWRHSGPRLLLRSNCSTCCLVEGSAAAKRWMTSASSSLSQYKTGSGVLSACAIRNAVR